MNLIEAMPVAPTRLAHVNVEPVPKNNTKRTLLSLAWVIGILGTALRLVPSAGFQGVGFDEGLYRRYVILLDGGEQISSVQNQDGTRTAYQLQLQGTGLALYPDLCDFFITSQGKADAMCELPPTRLLYIYASWLWKRAEFGDQGPAKPGLADWARKDPALVSLHRIAGLFSVLTLAVAGIAAWRMMGPKYGVCVLALMAAAPSALHMSQHALIDGFFAFWATLSMWLLWENLRRPNDLARLLALAASLALMVMTKENAFFVYCGLAGIVITNHWLKFGRVTPRLLAAFFLGPLIGVLLLMILAGGAETFVRIYQLLVTRASNLEYARLTGDGPWYRYFVDYMIISPVVLCLAIGAIFTSLRGNRALTFVAVFIAGTYLIMCNIRYGMNLRYATIWDLPLRMLAVAQIGLLAQAFPRRHLLALSLMIASLAVYELRQYHIFSVKAKIYEMVTVGLLHAVDIYKTKTPL